ncbi:MAG: circularly permuted type 2 ATP-grasp protein [Mogibacterium sp.]|nr:circularly permuted type 2 ATP-grasp protein [Mogibacterium sp.]
MQELNKHVKEINHLLERYGVRFGIYKDGVFKEQLFPFDPIPRVIGKQEWDEIEAGLIQRVTALNLFLQDIYGDKKIVKDGVIPPEFIFSSSGYLAACEGMRTPKGIASHISGIDLVQGKDGKWYVLEDNLRIPSGASYPLIARDLCRKASPSTFANTPVADNRDYAALLRSTMNYVNTGGLNVILTPGRYNAAFFEHSYLAERTGAVLAYNTDLFVEDDKVYLRSARSKRRVGAIYRRTSDEYLDPLAFNPESLIGVPGLFQAYRKGNVALLNAPGNGVADDKGIYYFVPKMVEYYLGESCRTNNAPTYLPYYEEDKKYVLENFDKLVIKDVAEAGGYGVVFGSSLTKAKREEFIETVKAEPRRFIAQEVIDFIDLDILDDDGVTPVPRKADLRAYVLAGETVRVWKSGLTRFSRNPDSFIVNSSQGGGFKDTWVLLR